MKKIIVWNSILIPTFATSINYGIIGEYMSQKPDFTFGYPVKEGGSRYLTNIPIRILISQMWDEITKTHENESWTTENSNWRQIINDIFNEYITSTNSKIGNIEKFIVSNKLQIQLFLINPNDLDTPLQVGINEIELRFRIVSGSYQSMRVFEQVRIGINLTK